MKRVGSKPFQLVRSVSRRKKAASRFRFDITIDSVYGLRTNNTYVIKCARGVKVESTEPFIVPLGGDSSNGFDLGQTLTLQVTLYHEEGRPFDVKEAKLSLVNTKRMDRTIAKTKFDMSQYAGAPSASSQRHIDLSDKVSLKVTINSRFLKSGASGPRSDASSAVSGLSTGDSVLLSDEIDDFVDPTVDDFSELDMSRNSIKSIPPVQSTVSLGLKYPHPALTIAKQSLTDFGSGDALNSAQEQATLHIIRPASPRDKLSKRDLPSNVNDDQHVNPNNSSKAFSKIHTSENDNILITLQDERVQIPPEQEERHYRLDDYDTNQRQINELSSKVFSLVAEVEEISIQRDQLHLEHHRERTELQRQLEERVCRIDELHASRDEAVKAHADLEQSNLKLRRTVEDLTAELTFSRSALEDFGSLQEQHVELKRNVEELKVELASYARERDKLEVKYNNEEEKCRQLSEEIDRLSLLSEKFPLGAGNVAADKAEQQASTLPSDMTALDKDEDDSDPGMKSGPGSYERLKEMYNNMCETNAFLKHELEAERKSRDSIIKKMLKESNEKSVSPTHVLVERSMVEESDEKRTLIEQLEEIRKQFQGAILEKEATERDRGAIQRQISALRDQLDNSSEALKQSQCKVEDLHREMLELKRQRDMALQRALSKSKANLTSNSDAIKAAEELRIFKERFEEERERFAQHTTELEKEISDLREDLNFEKSEKLSARAERDKMRETARALERRTSQTAQVTDALQLMRKQLSAQQMRDLDQQSIITRLKEEVESLRTERDKMTSLGIASNVGEIQDVLKTLVVTKVALAEAQCEKQELEFQIRQLRKGKPFTHYRFSDNTTCPQEKLTETEAHPESYQVQGFSQRSPGSRLDESDADVEY